MPDPSNGPSVSRPARAWYWPPWQLTNPWGPLFWIGCDEFGRRTLAVQPPLLGVLIIAIGPMTEDDPYA